MDSPGSNFRVLLTTRAAAFNTRWSLSVVAFVAPANIALQYSVIALLIHLQIFKNKLMDLHPVNWCAHFIIYLLQVRGPASKATRPSNSIHFKPITNRLRRKQESARRYLLRVSERRVRCFLCSEWQTSDVTELLSCFRLFLPTSWLWDFTVGMLDHKPSSPSSPTLSLAFCRQN